MSCQVCHSWICKCADTLPDAIKLRDHIARIAALDHMGDMAAICTDCAKTHEVVVREKIIESCKEKS